MNKKLSLSFLFWLFKYCNLPFSNAAYAAGQSPPYMHSQCQGLNSVYDGLGNLRGYRGTCDVRRWNGQSPSINSMHPIDMKMLSNSINEPRGIAPNPENQAPDKNFFDWLTPHHDIIRNNPHYRKAHFGHHQCIHKKKSGLFDFIGSLFESGSNRKFDDPYRNLDNHSRCLTPEYYKNNIIDLEKNNYDPFAIGLGNNILNLQNQINSLNDTDELDQLRQNLHDHYDRLHRHFDCHCHHELPDSRIRGVHHYPTGHHSIETLSHPDTFYNSNYPLQMNSTMPADASMDLEDERMALMRMSGLASQQAYNMDQVSPNSLFNTGTLRMQMFHPVNSYGQLNYDQNIYEDPDWNRLKVEKVIVIKRLKVPVVKNIPVPVPVPVPYPIDSSATSNAGNYNGLSYGGMESELNSVPQGYIGNNTYMIDSEETVPTGMDSIVQAISGAPCNCADTSMNYEYYQAPLNGNPIMPTPIQPYNNYSNQAVYNQRLLQSYQTAPTQTFSPNQIGSMYPVPGQSSIHNFDVANVPKQVSTPLNPLVAVQSGLQISPSPSGNNYSSQLNSNVSGIANGNTANAQKFSQIQPQTNYNGLLQNSSQATSNSSSVNVNNSSLANAQQLPIQMPLPT